MGLLCLGQKVTSILKLTSVICDNDTLAVEKYCREILAVYVCPFARFASLMNTLHGKQLKIAMASKIPDLNFIEYKCDNFQTACSCRPVKICHLANFFVLKE